MFHVPSNPAWDICKSNQPAGSTVLMQFEHANQLLMSVGGNGHRIPQCNHLTLFGNVVSVVEFPRTASSFVGCFRSFPSGEVASQFVDSVSVVYRQL